MFNVDDWNSEDAQYRQITGTHYTSTIGFSRRPIIALVPITVVGLASLLILTFTMLQKRRAKIAYSIKRSDSTSIVLDGKDHKLAKEVDVFDVGDPLHLLAALSMGGINGTFGDEFSEIGMKAGQRTRVKLGRVDQGGKERVGFVHA